MRKRFLPFLASILLIEFACPLQAQELHSLKEKIDIGASFGPMFFLGDLGGNTGSGTKFIKDVNLKTTKPSAGLLLSYHATDWLAFRIAATIGAVSGNDAQAPSNTAHDTYRLQRNLSFRSGIHELYTGVELYPFNLIPFMKRNYIGRYQPYFIGGVGIFHFNPEAKDIDGSWVRLQPLRLEGQGFAEYPNSKPYKLTQKNLQFGIGIKYQLNGNTWIGAEFVERKLFTDYVDDVSMNYYVDPALFANYLNPASSAIASRLYYKGTYNLGGVPPYQSGLERGNPNQKDAYFNMSVTLTKRIFKQNRDPRNKCPYVY
jgi:hypothetical protein